MDAYQALRGIQHHNAVTLAAEFGDLTRFDTPRRLAAFVGLIPSEYSTGTARRLGPITIAGNGHGRRALVKAAWAYRAPAKVSAHLQRRIESVAKPVQAIASKEQVRLCRLHCRLVAPRKHPNVSVTAIARESPRVRVGHRPGRAPQLLSPPLGTPRRAREGARPRVGAILVRRW